MKCCDTCKHFVLLPKRLEGLGWCNAPLPEWLENVEMMLGRQASMVKSDAGKECASYQDVPHVITDHGGSYADAEQMRLWRSANTSGVSRE